MFINKAPTNFCILQKGKDNKGNFKRKGEM